MIFKENQVLFSPYFLKTCVKNWMQVFIKDFFFYLSIYVSDFSVHAYKEMSLSLQYLEIQ